MEEEYIKLIFGLKLKQVRADRELSLFGLSKLSGLSKSYLNEIEKGKKYPKPDKISILAECLEVPYDELVSLKLDKNLAPIGEILQSKILKEIPLELFGIQESTLIDIVSNAPSKVTAFISTIIEIAKQYSFSRESFYLASVRSYQEANYNYFEDLEQAVLRFSKRYQIDLSKKIKASDLEDILVEEYGYTINNSEISSYDELESLRSVFVPKSKTLLLSEDIDEAQRAFIYGKEIAYNHLEITERLYTFSWIKFDNFDQVLNNFYASYFAGSLVIPKKQLTSDVKAFFSKKRFKINDLESILTHYNASAESVFQRLTNILPKDFNLKNLFFLRFSYNKGSKHYDLNKELHLSKQQSPHGNEINEHYCRRWISIQALNNLIDQNGTLFCDAQISYYPNEDKRYLVLTAATPDPFKADNFRSVSIGIHIDGQSKKKIGFLDSKALKQVDVGVTCERCAIKNCKERQAPPSVLENTVKDQKISETVEKLQQKFNT